MKPVVFFLTILCILSCHFNDNKKLSRDEDSSRHETKKEETQNEAVDKTSSLPTSFFDSIAQRYNLSFEQIRKYTLIDSTTYTLYQNSTFAGDTIFQLTTGYKIAIVNHNDGMSCSEKYLLVFKPTGIENSDLKLIYSACDRDESANYFYDRYKLSGDSTFKTISYFVPANSHENFKPIEDSVLWIITYRGRIDSVPRFRKKIAKKY